MSRRAAGTGGRSQMAEDEELNCEEDDVVGVRKRRRMKDNEQQMAKGSTDVA